MKTENILKADVLDIIFENRNKVYGAYELRKYYHERLYKALGLSLLFIPIVCVYVLIHKENIVLKAPVIETFWGSIPKVRIDQPKEKPMPPKTPVKPRQPTIPDPFKTQQWTSMISIVKDNTTVSKLAMNPDSVAISGVTSDGPSNAQVIKAGDEVKTNTGHTDSKLADKNEPLTSAEIMPSYPGGEAALIKFLQRNLVNPRDLGDDENVTVKIGFIVGYDGVLKRFEILQDGGNAFNNEVIRVLKKMPAWVPGKTSGENVSVYYSIPVKFISQ
jgi:protein TonB